jgi:hypothetical protein
MFCANDQYLRRRYTEQRNCNGQCSYNPGCEVLEFCPWINFRHPILSRRAQPGGLYRRTLFSGPPPPWIRCYDPRIWSCPWLASGDVRKTDLHLTKHYLCGRLFRTIWPVFRSHLRSSQGITAGPLNIPSSSAVGGNGVYTIGRAFPTKTYESSNYLVDVSFTSTAPTPYLTLNFNPANPSIASNAPAGSVVATIIATWSDGSPFTGALSFGPPYSNDNATFAISGNTLIVNPAGPGLSSDAHTIQNVTIVATQ